MTSINTTTTKTTFLSELYKAIKSFNAENKQEGLVYFELFCKYASDRCQIKDPSSKIYRRIWKVMGQPMPHSHPSIAHDDYGRVAFHDQDGRTAPNAVKGMVLEFYFIHVVQKELKKIAAQFRSYGNEGALKEFQNLFKDSREIPLLEKIENLIYNKTWERMGKPTETHLPHLSHPDFGRVAFHDIENRSTTPPEKADAIDAVIRQQACSKFWLGHYLQQANNYFQRNALEIRPADTRDLPRLPDDEKAILRKLFETYQGVCFGESHQDRFVVDFLHPNLDFLKQLGIKTLFMELFPYELQTDLEAFNRGEEPSKGIVDRCLDADSYINGRLNKNTQRIFLPLITEVRDRGIRIVGIDSESASLASKTNGRIEEMNYVSAKIICWEKKNDKFLAWMGSAHLTYLKIREVITFPAILKMKDLFQETYPDLPNSIVETYFKHNISFALDVIASKVFNCDRYNHSNFNYRFDDEKFIEIMKTKIHSNQKEAIIPGVSELIQCPSILMKADKRKSLHEEENEPYPQFCLNDQTTLGVGSFSKANFEFIEKSKS